MHRVIIVHLNYKKIDNQELDMFWNITKSDDLIIKKKVIDSDFESKSKFFWGHVNHIESFICKTNIFQIIDKNVFELEKNPGIIINPVDKINWNI